ncbi:MULTISPECIES: tripartite tricarboxylate transporter substrate binding protein [unclassified Achromobacter]|uniref:Bug family tripartite tricarboxylate transporter substrate binding protein n=1 Tax=unclassified Achromobacter TaxID=2626865 RepID=UPI000B5181A8|nr:MULTISPECIES: tripartite tricarboxylate transporter substrate binding protein [unclassified Achromobacter]OWT73583.1 LacI family transcriptional regulator [Achromobacter sp. HZ34]OWT79500.1 LacI family transcriptional regulator [Achromobacter sp. HZ28]
MSLTPTLTRRLAALFAVTAAGTLAAVPVVQAKDTWPDHPITIVSPYAPGGTTDILARLLAPRLQAKFGQAIVVENRAGAGGNIGTAYVAKAKPDGYTFLLAASGPIVIAGTLYKTLPYRPGKDFTAVSPLADTNFVVAVNTKSGLNSIQDVIAKAKTGDLSFGSAGSGTPQHIIGEMFNVATKQKIQHIPYKGSGPLLNDLVGGQVPLAFENPLPIMQQVKAGNLKVLAVTGSKRSAALPDVPTLAETGVQGVDAKPWYGLLGPAGLPADITTRMNEAVQEILASPDVKAQLASLGVEPMVMKPKEYQAFMDKDIVRWGAAVKASGATVD